MQGSDSYDVIIPRNIVAILGTSTTLNSELVKVTGAQKKEYNTIPYEGKEQVEKMKSHSDLTFFDAKKEQSKAEILLKKLDEKRGLDVRRSAFAVHCYYIQRIKTRIKEFANKHGGTQDMHN